MKNNNFKKKDKRFNFQKLQKSDKYKHNNSAYFCYNTDIF